MQDKKTIAVVVLNYNSSFDCIKCVSFLKKQIGVDLGIIIVDNCSQKVDCDRIKRFCEKEDFTFFQSRENKGYSAGNNIGLKHAAQKGYKYVVVANPDMEFPQIDYFSKMVAKMEEDSNIAVLGTDIIDVEGNHQNPMVADSFWGELVWPISVVRGFLCKDRKSRVTIEPSGYCSLLVGCCLTIRIDFLKLINFLDEGVFLYCEEQILAMQVKRADKRLYYLAESSAMHMHIKNMKGKLGPRLNQLCKSRNYKNKYYSDYGVISCFFLRVSSGLRIFAQHLIFKLRCFGR